jgi:hypothetical protein
MYVSSAAISYSYNHFAYFELQICILILCRILIGHVQQLVFSRSAHFAEWKNLYMRVHSFTQIIMYPSKESHPEEYFISSKRHSDFLWKASLHSKTCPFGFDPNIPSPTALPSPKSMCFLLFMLHLFS